MCTNATRVNVLFCVTLESMTEEAYPVDKNVISSQMRYVSHTITSTRASSISTNLRHHWENDHPMTFQLTLRIRNKCCNIALGLNAH